MTRPTLSAAAAASRVAASWARRPSATTSEPLWFEWVTLAGLFVFAGWLLGARGVWALLLSSDPTGITLVIVILFVGATLWCGHRARQLEQEHRLARHAGAAAAGALGGAAPGQGWVHEYWGDLRRGGADAAAPLDLLIERCQGPHATAWWVNGIQLKLGLLGKVIGFSILALEIGHIQNFDPSQAQDLLRSLTLGLGVALLTTMVGLVGNILLGLQLTRLDRAADALLAYAQREGLAIRSGAAAPTAARATDGARAPGATAAAAESAP